MYLCLSLVERKVAEFYLNDLFSLLFQDNWWCVLGWRSWRRRWGTHGEAHQPGISRTWVSMSTEWLMILLSRQLWQRLHIVRTAISQALLALHCRLIEPHRRRIVTGAGGEEWRCPFSGLEAFCSKWRWAKMVFDDTGLFMWIRLSFFFKSVPSNCNGMSLGSVSSVCVFSEGGLCQRVNKIPISKMDYSSVWDPRARNALMNL